MTLTLMLTWTRVRASRWGCPGVTAGKPGPVPTGRLCRADKAAGSYPGACPQSRRGRQLYGWTVPTEPKVPSEPTDEVFVKRRTDAPPGFFAWEAAGLAWLAEATEAGGAAVVGVREVGERHIVLDRIMPGSATGEAAEALGQALAITHAAGATAFGAGPPGWHGDGFIGRQGLRIKEFRRWGEFYATTRLLPYATAAEQQGTLSPVGARLVDRVCERLMVGEFDDDRPPARIHGDLWGGNLLYSPGRYSPGRYSPDSPCAVLIDPAAHGGHGQTDLAMLELFGTPQLQRVQAAYAEAAELPSDWPERTGLHQLHPLLVHAVTHGPSYGLEAVTVARQYA